MERNKTKKIPEIFINSYSGAENGLLIIGLEELFGRYSDLVSNSHRCLFYQLILVTEGECSVCVDSVQSKCEPKTLLPISKGQVEICSSNDNIKGYALLFSEEYINKYPGDIGWVNNLEIFDFKSSPLLLNLNDMEYLDLLLLFNNTKKELGFSNGFGREEVLFNLLKVLLITSERIKRARIKESKNKNSCDLNLLDEFRNILDKNFYTERSVKYYSDTLNITPKKLNRITSNYWGKSSKQVIEERVLLETKRLLLHTSQSVKEIGIALGFTDPTNFNKFFKKSTNMTPVNYRTEFRPHLDHNKASINH
jgi:AraC-like DNA-binding protein